MARKWRKEPQSGGRWRLVTGRGSDRVRVTLGAVSEDKAERARGNLEAEDERDGAARVLALLEHDRETALAFLFGVADLFPAQKDPGGLSLAAYFAEHFAPVRKRDRPLSWRREERLWKSINAGPLGRRTVRQLSSPEGDVILDEYLTSICTQDGGPASVSYKRLHRAALKSLLKHARRKRHVQRIPEFFELDSRENPGRGPTDVLDADERDRLIASEPDVRLRALWALASYLGPRPSELMRARWEDFDFDARGRGSWKVRGSKTEASKATVPLFGPCRAHLLEWHMGAGRPREGIVFPARAGSSKPYKSDMGYRRALRTACARAGITGKNITPYSLRHTAATLAAKAGVRPSSIAKLLRHSNPRMVEQRYDHSGALDLPDLELLG